MMKNITIIAIVAAISLGTFSALAKEKVPHVNLKGQRHYSENYQKAKGHKAFVIAPGGRWNWKNGQSSAKALQSAMDRCLKKNQICVPYDVDGKKVFDEMKWASVLAPYPVPSAAASAKIGGKKGDLFPDLAFKTQGGEKKSISDYRGKILFVNIWASWCPPCQTEMPSLNILYEKYKNNPDVEFLIIGTRESMVTSLRFVKRKKLTMPIYHTGITSKKNLTMPLKGGDEISMKKFSHYIPTTILVDRNGVVIWRKISAFNYWEQFAPQLEHAIQNAN